MPLPLRELVSILHILAIALPLVVLAILARRNVALRLDLVPIVPLVAIFCASRGFFGALFRWRDASTAEGCRPLLAVCVVVVVMAFGWSASWLRGAHRAIAILGAVALLVPMLWIGTRA